jgi:hypothetical protein
MIVLRSSLQPKPSPPPPARLAPRASRTTLTPPRVSPARRALTTPPRAPPASSAARESSPPWSGRRSPRRASLVPLARPPRGARVPGSAPAAWPARRRPPLATPCAPCASLERTRRAKALRCAPRAALESECERVGLSPDPNHIYLTARLPRAGSLTRSARARVRHATPDTSPAQDPCFARRARAAPAPATT